MASLASLLSGDTPTVSDKSVPLEVITERLVIGGFPGLLGASETQAFDVNRAYLDLIAEIDISRISGMKRDPQKVQALIRSLARNTATLAEVTTLAADVGEREKADISRPTATDYLAALDRLMIVENQPAWDVHLRSSASLLSSLLFFFVLARKLRVQYEGAIYYVTVHRGGYRFDGLLAEHRYGVFPI